MTIAYHADLKEVQGNPALAGLLDGVQALSPFDRLDWWLSLAIDCGLRPLLAIVQDGEALGVLPLQGEAGHVQALANWYNFTVRPVFSEGANRLALLGALAMDLRRKGWRVTLAPLPDEQGEATLLQQAFTASGWLVERERYDVNHVLRVGGRSYAEYLAGRPGPLRTTLKRKAGKIRVELLRGFDPAAWAAYEAVYAASWKPEESSIAFLRHFAEREGAAGRLRMALAWHDGAAVAAQLWTVEAGTAYIHKLAHIEAARALSPGTTLSAALFAEVIDRDRVDLVDFGTGDDPYKRDWMEDIRPRYRIDCFNPARVRAWPYIVRAVLRRLAPGGRHG